MRNIIFLVIPLIAIIAAGAAGAVWMRGADQTEMEGDLAAHDISEVGTTHESDIAPATGETETGIEIEDVATPEPVTGDGAVKASDIHITVEGNDPKAPRSIGPVDAPVTMIEYSSLTCPHCAHAHETIVPRLIREYVEAGKLRIVFSDFPLNQQALDASKVSRCVASDQYFNFLTLLFGSIEQWAYSNTHPTALIQNAVLTGLPEDRAKACMADAEIEKALITSVQEAAQKYQISSTPTFVLNDGAKIIQGARSYDDFKSAIDALLTPEQ